MAASDSDGAELAGGTSSKIVPAVSFSAPEIGNARQLKTARKLILLRTFLISRLDNSELLDLAT